MVPLPVESAARDGTAESAGLADVELTILMPCLDEAETLGACVERASRYLAGSGVSGEVLVADNGSSDGSPGIARALGARVVQVSERGYGAALLGGIAAARGRFVIMADADGSYDFGALDPFVERLRGGAQVVIGNRFRGGIAPGAMPFLHRYLGNPVLSFLGRLFFRIPIGDFHCGLRGFDAAAVRALRLQTTGMEFASEMVVRAALAGLRIEEAPTTLAPDGRSRPPHLRTWRDGWRHLKFLLLYSPRWLFFYPGAAAAAVGLLLAVALLPGPIHLTPAVEMDHNAFVAACFLFVTGVQVITFGVLSRSYAAAAGLLPTTRTSEALLPHVSTERMALLGAALAAAGLAAFGYALGVWAARGFGNLEVQHIPRIVIAGLTLLVVGVQMVFAAFLLGALAVPKTREGRE